MPAGSSLAPATATRDFIFVRHGETDWNREKRIQGSKGAPMNPAGHEEPKGRARARWEVPIQAVYSSAMPRAVETASYVAGPHRVNVAIDPRLNEIHHGEWEGLAESELPDLALYRKWREDPTAVTLPGAQPLAPVHAPALAPMRPIAPKHPASEGLVPVAADQP